MTAQSFELQWSSLSGTRPKREGAALTGLEPSIRIKDATASILVTVPGMVSEMDHKFIRGRQQICIEVAKTRGVYPGRKATLPVNKVHQLHAAGVGPSAIAKETGDRP